MRRYGNLSRGSPPSNGHRAIALLFFLAAGLLVWNPIGTSKEPQRFKAGLTASALVGITASPEGGSPASPEGAIPYREGTAEESTRGARMLYEQFVKNGKVAFVDSACSGTEQDFRDQMARLHTDRGPGRGTFINPTVWRQIQVIAEGQERRKAKMPYVEVSCLARAHSITTKSGSGSNHPGGNAVDIGVIGGYRIGSPRQYPNDPVSQAIKDLWDAKLYSCQVISAHGRGGIQDIINPGVYNRSCGWFRTRGAFADFGKPGILDGHEDHLHLDAHLGG